MDARQRWILAGLAVALTVAVLSPFASQDPDGLQRVAVAHGFDRREQPSWAERLPFARFFSGYALRGLEDPAIARGLAGAAGTLVVFAAAWGLGALARRSNRENSP